MFYFIFKTVAKFARKRHYSALGFPHAAVIGLFKWAHRMTSRVEMSGARGGHFLDPLQPIDLPGNLSVSHCLTGRN